MDDLISRQAAIDALNEYFDRIGKLKRRGLNKGEKAIRLDTVGAIKTLPTIQPEIVRCKDCKHYRHGLCMKASMCVNKSTNGFCDWGER